VDAELHRPFWDGIRAILGDAVYFASVRVDRSPGRRDTVKDAMEKAFIDNMTGPHIDSVRAGLAQMRARGVL
jgi:hypothetical protein